MTKEDEDDDFACSNHVTETTSLLPNGTMYGTLERTAYENSVGMPNGTSMSNLGIEKRGDASKKKSILTLFTRHQLVTLIAMATANFCAEAGFSLLAPFFAQEVSRMLPNRI